MYPVVRMYSWLLVLVFLMARGGPGAKRRRSSAQLPAEEQAVDVGSEYNPGDDSAPESEEEDWEAITTNVRSKKKGQDKGKTKEKGKSEAKGKGKGKEKIVESEQPGERQTYGRGHRRTGGISIHEPGDASPVRAVQVPVDHGRRSMYSSKTCIGERDIGVANLCAKVPSFRPLYENGDLHKICCFPEQTGYGLELIRAFYMRAGDVVETDGGAYVFTTSVRGVEMSITPATIASVLGMEARTDGIDYMKAGLGSAREWKRVHQFLCVREAENNGIAILSKDLKLEYRFLNFVVCYNIMPLANTKVIRWDRILYMYLLGHREIVQQKNINLNIPFLIWKRMAREIKTSSKKDRLPFPLLIMRILRLHEVNVVCSSYERSLGPIGDTTMAKSHVQLHPNSPPRYTAPASPTDSGSDDDASISSIYREQQRLSGEVERLAAGQEHIATVQAKMATDQERIITDVARLNKKYGRISCFLRILCEKMGCGSKEMPPADTDDE